MADWMDDLRNTLAEDERTRKEAEERERQSELQISFAIGQVFGALQKSVELSIPTLNQRLFESKKIVIFGYEDNMITGDQFIITNLPLRYFVKKVPQQIECRLREGSYPDWDWVSVENGAKDVIVTTNGEELFQTQDTRRETVRSIEEVTERLLSTIVRASAAIRRERPPARPRFFLE